MSDDSYSFEYPWRRLRRTFFRTMRERVYQRARDKYGVIYMGYPERMYDYDLRSHYIEIMNEDARPSVLWYKRFLTLDEIFALHWKHRATDAGLNLHTIDDDTRDVFKLLVQLDITRAYEYAKAYRETRR